MSGVADPSAAEALSAQPMMDGPNTHRYRGYPHTTVHVVDVADVDGVVHHFHVPAELVAALDRERAAALPTLEVEDLRAALEVISEGRHPDGHRGAVLVARAALIGKAVPRG